MTAETPTLATSKFRKCTSPAGEFYLASGVVTENGKPKVYVSRWGADNALRELETQYSSPKSSIQLPTLYDSHIAAEQDNEIMDSIFSFPSEWQSTLILNPNAPPDTENYVLMDDQERVLKKSEKPRSLNPIKIYKEGEKNVVVANIFDVPFKLQDGRYNGLENLNPETGFFSFTDKPLSEGRYGLWFGSDERLYAVILYVNGHTNCCWEPTGSAINVGFRGRFTGNRGQELPESLLESEIDVLNAKHAMKIRQLKAQNISALKKIKPKLDQASEILESLMKELEDQ